MSHITFFTFIVVLVAATALSIQGLAQGTGYEALRSGNCIDVVKQIGKIVDKIDASQELSASRFKETQPSKLVDSPVGKVRQFGPADRAGVSYLLQLQNPGKPHVVRVYYPDITESSMFVSVTDPSGPGWQFAVHTGGEHPISMQEHFVDVVCFPTTKDPALALFNDRPGHLASFSKVEVYELNDLPPAQIVLPPDGGRDIGLYTEHFQTTWINFGPGYSNDFAEKIEPWKTVAERLSSYMRFTGQNLFVGAFYFYNWCTYPSKVFGPKYVDWPRAVLDQFQKDGLRLIPQIYLHDSSLFGDTPTKEQIAAGADTTAVVCLDGTTAAGESKWATADPSDPRVREVFRKAIKELVDQYADSPAMAGISLLISKGLSNSYSDIRWGYGDLTIQRFTKDTHIKIPVDPKAPDRFRKRYEWLMSNARERWIKWRNAQVARLNEELRRIVISKRPDLEFHLSYREPRDVEVFSGYVGDKTTHELLRDKGLDPLLAKRKPGMFIDMPYQAGANWRFDGEAYLTPLTQSIRQSWISPEVNRLFENGDQSAVWIYPELSERKCPFPDWWWGMKAFNESMNGTEVCWGPPYIASGRCFLEPYARALIMQDAKQIYAGGWSHVYPGNKNLLREFAVEYRTLPRKTFISIPGQGDHSVVVRELVEKGKRYVYAVNASQYRATAKLFFETPVGNTQVKRISTSEILALKPGEKPDKIQVLIELEPYQLKTFVIDSTEAKIKNYEARSEMPRTTYELPFTWGEDIYPTRP